MRPSLLLRLEGLAVLAAAVAGYAWTGASWWLFVALFLTPDLSMLGYVRNAATGSIIYNAAHTYFFPAALAGVALYAGNGLLLALALIWIAHIGFDRVLGYGLKYPTGFKDTHLQRV
jgi:hypothetical protein